MDEVGGSTVGGKLMNGKYFEKSATDLNASWTVYSLQKYDDSRL